MMRTIYKENTVHYKRLSTDRFFIDDELRAEFSGIIERAIDYVQKEQLLDEKLWAEFVDQFRDRRDDTDGGWRGEYWGKMMRGASFVYSCSRDERLYRVMCESVNDLLSTVDENGRISSRSPEFDFNDWDVWCRKYVLLGLSYFCEICGDDGLVRRCVSEMERQAGLFISAFGDGKRKLTEVTGIWRGLAASSVLEPFVRLYDVTGKKEYLDFASYIVSLGGTSIADIFELAYEDQTDPYQFPVTKAYEMMSCFEGIIEYYRATGDEKYKAEAVNFARRVAATDITVIGSAGCTHELFDHSRNRQTDTTCEKRMQETCVTVTWMKLCLQMLSLTGDVTFADLFERSLYNAYLGSLNTQRAVDERVKNTYPLVDLFPLPFDSYSPLMSSTRGSAVGGLKDMSGNTYYGCCACIGSAGIGLVHKTAVMLNENGLAVNLFVPGRITSHSPSGQAVGLSFETEYPADGEVKITLELNKPEEFTLLLRIPEWSEKTGLCVNGSGIPAQTGYTEIKRVWKNGDVVALGLDMRAKALRPERWGRDIIMTDYRWRDNFIVPRVIKEPSDSRFHTALRRGPLMLALDSRTGRRSSKPVDIEVGEDSTVELAPAAAPFPVIAAFRVPEKNGGSFIAVDYASAGKDSKNETEFACWMKTKD